MAFRLRVSTSRTQSQVGADDKHPPRSAGYQPHHLRGRLSAPAVITADIGEAAASLNVRVERHHRMPGVYVCVQPFGHLGAVERGDEQPCGAGGLCAGSAISAAMPCGVTV